MFNRTLIFALIIIAAVFVISFVAVNSDTAKVQTHSEIAYPAHPGPCTQSWCADAVAYPVHPGPCMQSWCYELARTIDLELCDASWCTDAIAKPMEPGPCIQSYCIIEAI